MLWFCKIKEWWRTSGPRGIWAERCHPCPLPDALIPKGGPLLGRGGSHRLFIYAKTATWQKCISAVTSARAPSSHAFSNVREEQSSTSSSVTADGISTHLTVVSWLLQCALYRTSGFWLAVCARGSPHTKLLRAGISTKNIADTAWGTLAPIVNNKLRCIGKTITKVRAKFVTSSDSLEFPCWKKKVWRWGWEFNLIQAEVKPRCLLK